MECCEEPGCSRKKRSYGHSRPNIGVNVVLSKYTNTLMYSKPLSKKDPWDTFGGNYLRSTHELYAAHRFEIKYRRFGRPSTELRVRGRVAGGGRGTGRRRDPASPQTLDRADANPPESRENHRTIKKIKDFLPNKNPIFGPVKKGQERVSAEPPPLPLFLVRLKV